MQLEQHEDALEQHQMGRALHGCPKMLGGEGVLQPL